MNPYYGWSILFVLSCLLCSWLGYVTGEAAGREKGCVVTPQMVEKATMTLLGHDHDRSPHVNWQCNRSWRVNDVRKAMRRAMIEAFKTVS